MVRRTQNGDSSAFDQLILRYQNLIAGQMRRFSRDPRQIEELTQNVFVSAFLGLKNYRPEAPFINWLRTIASRTGYAHWRGEYRQARQVPLEDWDAPVPGQSDAGEAAEELERLLTRLKPAEKHILYLLYIDGHSIAETAQITGWTEGMVKMRAHRARKKLQDAAKSRPGIGG